MKMPEKIEPAMFAPCGMNCMVCYKHCYHKKPCEGCIKGDRGKPEHCRKCRIKDCIKEKGLSYCFECALYPCKQVKALEKSYNTRYHSSLMANSRAVQGLGLNVFLEQQKAAYTCPKCGGIISFHDAECSECRYKIKEVLSMDNPLYFKTRDEFRIWLSQNSRSSEGVWLLFGKTKEIKTLKAQEALEEALCYGWIDGVMKRVDDKSYVKYFSLRRKNSKWSEKNKALVNSLEERGLMTEFGREKIEEAMKNGQWDNAGKPSAITEEQIEMVGELLKQNEAAYANFQAMSPSVKKTYTRAYLDAKTEDGKLKRLAWMTARLEKNLKPM